MSFKNYVITFNGMIYNYRDIRQALIQKGYVFTPKPILKCCLPGGLNGNKIYPRLQGMFAFAVWDKVSQRLILARDQFASHLLQKLAWRFAFGSRFDAVEALTETARLSHEALSWYSR